jgi:hypothetical protein
MMCFADNKSIRLDNPARPGELAYRSKRRERRREVGLLRWWWGYLFDPDFRLTEEGLALAAEIKAHPPALRMPVFLSERRRLMGRHHRWAAEDLTSAECAILRNLDMEDLCL